MLAKRRHIVIGMGEVGQAIEEVLEDHSDNIVRCADKSWSEAEARERFDAAHICFPWSLDFDYWVEEWIARVPADLVIVHSTVPVGTCDVMDVVHSPVSGKHPHLAQGVRTFVKYFGGRRAREAAVIFAEVGCTTHCYPLAKITEAMKIWATTQYGLQIMIEKEVAEWCCRNGVPFEEVYTRANKDYSHGYEQLQEPRFRLPYLKHIPGPVGGHCVIPNLDFLPDSFLAQLLKQKNKGWYNEQ